VDTARDSERPNAWVAIVEVTVECFNGRTIEDTTEVHFDEADAPPRPLDLDETLQEIATEIEEAATALAEEMSESCGGDADYTFDYTQDAVVNPEDPTRATMTISVHVDCANGRIIEDSTTLEVEVPPTDVVDPYWDYVEDTIEDAAREFAEQLAESCPEPSIEGRDVDDGLTIT
jgi:hypothetical protein